MAKFSFIEKIEVLKDIVFSSTSLSILFLLMIGVFLLFVAVQRKNKKMNRKMQIGIYLLIIAIASFRYGSALAGLCDGLMDNIFTTIYFPTPVAYIIMFIVTNLVMITTILKKNMTKLVKVINITSFVIISFLSIVALDLIVKNQIDIYSKTSIYTNTNLLVTIELAMIIFAVWMIILSLIYIIRRATGEETQNIKQTTEFIERPIYQYSEPIANIDHSYEELPNLKEAYQMLQIHQTISSNPNLYDQSGSVKFPNENPLKQVYYQQCEEKINVFKSICQKDQLNLSDYKQLRNVLEVAVENNAVEERDLERLISKFE